MKSEIDIYMEGVIIVVVGIILAASLITSVYILTLPEQQVTYPHVCQEAPGHIVEDLRVCDD